MLKQDLSFSQDSFQDIEVAQDVLKKEMDGLRALSNSLNDSFVKATNLIAHLTGRVIVSGMGKSGHVGRKIASTFASTGTPSFFVHPAEASHGDLGMIAQNDCVIALSNSGKTHELLDILEYTKRTSIPLIAITQNPDSPLAKSANFTLLLPQMSEACPIGLAPTTSTTMMMALGDSLALALLIRRGFSTHDFRRFHPGGELGRKVLTVKDLMHQGDAMPLVMTHEKMDKALSILTQKRFGCVGILNDHGQLIGIITDGDIRRHISPTFLEMKMEDVMTKGPETLKPENLAVEALARMEAKAITALFVVDNDLKPLGILNIHDCLKTGLI